MILLYQGTAIAHGRWVVRLVGVSTCSWVDAFVVASVRTWLIVCFPYCAVGGEHLSDDLLVSCVFFVRSRSGIVRRINGCIDVVLLLLLLYYYRTHIVGSWGDGECFLLCAVLYFCCIRYYVLL